jgi:hypothetical protein
MATEHDAWDPQAVEPGKLVLMPTFAFAELHREEKDGRRTFVSHDGTLLCQHGEKAGCITTWLHRERCAAQRGEPAPVRHSICDCQTADGLWSKATSLPTSAMPDSLFDYLAESGASKILHKGREARRVPWSHGMHLTTMGKLVCSHGCSKATLHDKRRQLRGNGDLKNRCACKPWSFPKRSALDGVQLGRYQGLRCRDNR